MKALFMTVTFCLLTASSSLAAAREFLILNDIGEYNFITNRKNPLTKKTIVTNGYKVDTVRSGIVQSSDHFKSDHIDTTYDTEYEKPGIGVAVEVTSHTGGESDKWLLHELEYCLRDDFGRRDESADYITVGSAEVFRIRIAGTAYYWLSNNVTIIIDYHDNTMTKSEPIEIVQAYLNKFPPTFPASYREFNTSGNDIKWIKNEFDRRLWLADKWAALIQPGDVELSKKLENMVTPMVIFLNYRAKYFSIKARDEIDNLNTLVEQKNETAIRAKLVEYKEWWAAHKSESIDHKGVNSPLFTKLGVHKEHIKGSTLHYSRI